MTRYASVPITVIKKSGVWRALSNSLSEGGTMNRKSDRFGSRFVARISVILASWLAAGAVQAPAQEGLSHAEDPALSPAAQEDRSGQTSLGRIHTPGGHRERPPPVHHALHQSRRLRRGRQTEWRRRVSDRSAGGDLPPEPRCLPGPDPVWAIERPAPPVPELPRAGGQSEYPKDCLPVRPAQRARFSKLLGVPQLDRHRSVCPTPEAMRSHANRAPAGGAGGFAGNAFINPNLPNPIFMFIRNAPHMFGSGYAQELAEEMTLDLLGLRTIALRDALANPGVAASQPLKAKTIEFGSFVVTYTGDPATKPGLKTVIDQLNDNPGQDPPGFKIQWDKIQGVSADLVVRPFQFKGIASNVRNFVRDACQFHFGMEPRESNPGFDTPSENHDSDNDGIPDELSLGDVSALTVYTMTIRPPFEVQSADEYENRLAKRGRNIFEGNEVFTKAVSCARCHTPSLHLIDSIVVVSDPRKEGAKFGPEQLVGNGIGLPAQLKSSAQLPVVRRFMELDPVAALANRDAGSALNALRPAWTRYELSFFAPRE